MVNLNQLLSPEEYRLIAQLAYNDENPCEEMTATLPGYTYIMHETVCSVNVILIKSPKNDLIVGFEGSSRMSHWINTIITFGGRRRAEMLLGCTFKFEKKLCEWTKFGKISTLVGHSKGGFYVHNLFLKQDLIRVSFNALNARCGKGHYPLRLPKDHVSKMPLSHKKRYVTLKFAGVSGHKLETFKRALKGKNWFDIRKIKFPCSNVNTLLKQKLSGPCSPIYDEIAG